MCVTSAPPTQPPIWVNHTHTHTHTQSERRQRSSFLMLLSFVLLLFYSWPCFNSQRLCLWRVILLLARERERERGRAEHLLVLLSSFGNVSSNIVSVSVCVSHRISWHGILLECVYTWPWIHTTNYLHTYTQTLTHMGSTCVCV